ncbi:MAG: DUF6166 domain-containing protein [Bacteroidota bacterium]
MYITTLRHTLPTCAQVARQALADETGLVVRDKTGGYQIPESDAYARRIAGSAERWLRYARAHSRMHNDTLVRKALDAVAFTLRWRANDLAVPSKLSGTSAHQRALWQLVRQRVGFGVPLSVADEDGLLVVSHDDARLGEIQRKHVGWVHPLLDTGGGARVHLTRITGSERGYTLGCNIALTGLGGALERLDRVRGHEVGGDGSGPYTLTRTVPGSAKEPLVLPRLIGGDGATEVPLVEVFSDADSVEDIRLWRASDGSAQANVEHVVTYSPTGIEWGYVGAGPGDLAVSILTHVAGLEATSQHAHALAHDIIARIPHEGGVIRAADMRAWLLARTTDLSA